MPPLTAGVPFRSLHAPKQTIAGFCFSRMLPTVDQECMQSSAPTSKRSLRWTEILLAGAFLLMVLLVAVPVNRRGEMASQADSMEITVHRLQRAVRRFIDDNGRGAVEFSGSSYLEPRFHDLSRGGDSPDWHGPYLTPGLTTADNPFGGFVYLYDSLRGGTATPHNGFRLEGQDGLRADDAGQFVAFGRIPESAAAELDARLDKNVTGDWKTEGRVQYDSSRSKILMVYLCPIDIWGKKR